MLLLVFRKICTITCQCSWHAFLFVGLLSKIGSRLKSVISLSLRICSISRSILESLDTAMITINTPFYICGLSIFSPFFDVFFYQKFCLLNFFLLLLCYYIRHIEMLHQKKGAAKFFQLWPQTRKCLQSVLFFRADGRVCTITFIFSVFFSSFRLPKHSSFCSMNLQKYFPDFNFDWFSWIRQ